MKNLPSTLSAFLIITVLCAFSAFAQLSGPLSGILEGDTTYTVVGDISVEEGDSLTIEAGATLIFDEGVQFDINGYIHAAGTENDSIKFINSPGLNWGGIDFNDSANDNSLLEYCLITGASSSGIHCYSSHSAISHCTIIGNSSSFYGGGFYLYASDPAISNCTISGNSAPERGGGLYLTSSHPAISNCTIIGNSSEGWGGGLYLIYDSSPAISNCTISGNSTLYQGGGLYLTSSSPVIYNCTISGNLAPSGGGGGIICLYYCSPTIENCTISGNTADYGGGIRCDDSSPYIHNTIVEGNSGFYGVYLDDYSSLFTFITYSDFYNNEIGNIHNPPQGVGQIVNLNANGDPCDGFYNIFLDPLFEDPANGNYQLTWTNFPIPDSTMSPCIDAGDPDSSLDPDGTIADIGAFYFDQSGAPPEPEISLSSNNLNFGEVAIGNTNDLELIVYNSGGADLELYDAYTSNPVFTTDFVVSTLAPGDSMIVIITFAPEEITNYSETLTIESNDDTVEVTLAGEGIGPVAVTMTPLNPPIIIPEIGGSFDFNAFGENFDVVSHTFDFWTLVLLPNVGGMEIMNVPGITLEAGGTISADRTQEVPDFAPAGTYTYFAYIGDYPWVVDHYDAFTFVKEGTDGGYLGNTDDWLCTGAPFGGETIASGIPETFALHTPYPNPFNPSTVISFELRDASFVELVVYDIQGREIARLIDGFQSAGVYEVTFNASELSSGVYFARLSAGKFQQTRKLLLIR